MEEAIFKFNGGNPVMLCSGCRTIIKTIAEMNETEVEALKGRRILESQYCKTCENEHREKKMHKPKVQAKMRKKTK